MDYAFAPGVSKYDKLGAQLMLNRPNTERIDAKGVTNIQSFFAHLDSTASIKKPTGDLFVVSHGNDQGWLQIDLDGSKPDPDQHYFEKLESAAAAGTIKIPESLRTASDGSLTPLTVHIRGCRIGESDSFMNKFKEALGGQVGLTAPRHFQIFWEYDNAIWEFLAYGFRHSVPDEITDRSEIVSAFVQFSSQFRDIENTEIDFHRWDELIPDQLAIGTHLIDQVVNLGQTVGSSNTLLLTREFRHLLSRAGYTISDLSNDPGNDSARLEALRTSIESNSLFADAHPFPVFKRFGYKTAGEFIDGFSWAWTWNSDKKELLAKGSRHDYIVVLPITDPSSDSDPAKQTLLFNFYPASGSGYSPVEELLTSNSALFNSV